MSVDEYKNDEKKKEEQDNSNSTDTEISISTSSRHMKIAVISSFIRQYGTVPINLLISYMIARNLPSDILGIFTHALVLINGAWIVSLFIPPSINSVVIFKVPELMLNKQFGEVKGLIWYANRVKIIISLILWAVYMIIAGIMISVPETRMKGIAVMIASPLIYIREFESLFSTLLNAIKNFTISVVVLFIEKAILVCGYIFIFYVLNLPNDITMYSMVFLNVIAFFPMIIVFWNAYVKRFGQIPREKITWKQIRTSVQFGMYYAVSGSLDIAREQIYFGILGLAPTESEKFYFNIARNMTGQAANAFILPIGPVLTDLEKTGKRNQMLQLYAKSVHLTNLILMLIGGLLYYFIGIYILLIYTPEYLWLIKVIRDYNLFLIFFNIGRNYWGLFSITKGERQLMYINIIGFVILCILSLLGYLIADLHGFILGQVIGTAMIALLCWGYGNFIRKDLKIPFLDVFQHAIALIVIIIIINLIDSYVIPYSFFTSMATHVGVILENLFGHSYESQMTIILNSVFYMICFSILFLVYVIGFRALPKKDVETMKKLGIKVPFQKILLKILR